MTEPTDDNERRAESVSHKRLPGIRFIYPAAAIPGGIILAVRYSGVASTGLFIAALSLVALGTASIPVFRWMDKRGL